MNEKVDERVHGIVEHETAETRIRIDAQYSFTNAKGKGGLRMGVGTVDLKVASHDDDFPGRSDGRLGACPRLLYFVDSVS